MLSAERRYQGMCQHIYIPRDSYTLRDVWPCGKNEPHACSSGPIKFGPGPGPSSIIPARLVAKAVHLVQGDLPVPFIKSDVL